MTGNRDNSADFLSREDEDLIVAARFPETGHAARFPGGARVMSYYWQPIGTAPENVVVRTKIHDQDGERNDQPLKRIGRLWFYPDGSMYVYYTPTHWTPLT